MFVKSQDGAVVLNNDKEQNTARTANMMGGTRLLPS